ncbi:MAG: DUF6650 family protein [Rikenellaceae bacterium]
MKYKVTGLSTPFGGVSFDKKPTSKDRFSSLLLFLESKRILVNPIEMEKKEWCIQSVLEIKHFLIEITRDIKFKDKEMRIVRNMIDACNSYLDDVSPLKLPNIIFKSGEHWEDMSFDKSMKQLRKQFGEEIQMVEEIHKLKFNKGIPEKY